MCDESAIENTPSTPPFFDLSTPIGQNMWDMLKKILIGQYSLAYWLSVVRGTACVQSNLR